MFTIPSFEVRDRQPFDSGWEGEPSSLLRYRAFFQKHEAEEVTRVDTVLVSDAFTDRYMFSNLSLDTLAETKLPLDFCHGIRFRYTYTLPTSAYWLKAYHQSEFRYVDCHAKLSVQDLGIHQAKLVNRLGSAPKNHFIERPVRVLYILEYIELKGACEPLDSLGP